MLQWSEYITDCSGIKDRHVEEPKLDCSYTSIYCTPCVFTMTVLSINLLLISLSHAHIMYTLSHTCTVTHAAGQDWRHSPASCQLRVF